MATAEEIAQETAQKEIDKEGGDAEALLNATVPRLLEALHRLLAREEGGAS